jgi:hypothetical protein
VGRPSHATDEIVDVRGKCRREEERRPSRVRPAQRAAERSEKRRAGRELSEHVQRPEPGTTCTREDEQSQRLERNEEQCKIDGPSRGQPRLEGDGETRAHAFPSPRRCPTSLKKIRRWAAGLARTSSLFM